MTRPMLGIRTAPASEATALSRPDHRPRLRPSTTAVNIANAVQPRQTMGTTTAATISTDAVPRAIAHHGAGRLRRESGETGIGGLAVIGVTAIVSRCGAAQPARGYAHQRRTLNT